MIEAELLGRLAAMRERAEKAESLVAQFRLSRYAERALEAEALIKEAQALTRRAEAERDAAIATLKWYAGDGSTYDGIDVGGPARDTLAALASAAPARTFQLGAFVHKAKGSSWRGRVVGYYSTSLTPDGVCVESDNEPGSVQIYPAAALASAT